MTAILAMGAPWCTGRGNHLDESDRGPLTVEHSGSSCGGRQVSVRACPVGGLGCRTPWGRRIVDCGCNDLTSRPSASAVHSWRRRCTRRSSARAPSPAPRLPPRRSATPTGRATSSRPTSSTPGVASSVRTRRCSACSTKSSSARPAFRSSTTTCSSSSRTPAVGCAMRDLAGRLLVSRSGATRLIDRMEKDGHVIRERCSQDGRGQYAVLTAEGHATLERARRRTYAACGTASRAADDDSSSSPSGGRLHAGPARAGARDRRVAALTG